MPTLPVYNEGEQTAKSLADSVFGAKVDALLRGPGPADGRRIQHRQSENQGRYAGAGNLGGKGTAARRLRRSPIWTGGGVVFPPAPGITV